MTTVLWQGDGVRVVPMTNFDDCIVEWLIDGEWRVPEDKTDGEAFQVMCSAFMSLYLNHRGGSGGE